MLAQIQPEGVTCPTANNLYNIKRNAVQQVLEYCPNMNPVSL